ncbi:phage tail tip lysozyme [Pectinatus haikarae]|uniref:Phage tail lysozyme domain-containing protein n=1 Tax=Pectinatus haikarae TaxID=349096 RepID=A0ABT9Y3S7_9FIRM|nr:phage tail tip lysozyme [Pectinatus haikarae]MDQ0202475.1 hypothetical protein [Pectinatus haikarae]
MIGELIKEYLVGLGVQIDKPGFNQLDSTIKTTSGTIESATGSWAANFVKASTIIGTAVASVTTAVAGMMKAAADQDLAMEKLSRRMMVSKDAAWEMKKATDALGESVSDIVITPELMNRYKQLVADGRQMKPGGDFQQTMKSFRDLMFEFTRLKQEVSYVMTWVGYYLMKYLNRPLQEAKENFKSFNDSFIRNMSVWTEKAARYLVYIINIGIHFWDLIKGVTKSVYGLWESFPRGIKIATAALAGFFLLLRASPFGRMIALVSTLLLLIDDYFGYMEGKQAEFGKYWDKLNTFIDIAKQKITAFANAAEPFWEEFINYVILAKNKIEEFGNYLGNLINEVGNSKEFNDFINTVKRLGKALWDLGSGIIDAVASALKSLYDSMKDSGAGAEFEGFLSRLWDIFLGLINVISYCLEVLGEWLREAARSETVKELIEAISDLAAAFLELFNAIIDLVKIALSSFFKGMDKTQHVYSFRDALREVVKFISAMIRGIATLIHWLSQLLKMMMDNRLFREFWEGIGKAVKFFTDIVFGALKAVGKLGQALISLVSGDYKRAAKLAGQALNGDSGGSESGNGDTDHNAEVVYQRFKKAGWDDEAIAGIMGRVQQEHNFDTSDVPEQDIEGVGHVGGYGMFQWNGGRKEAFLSWAAKHGLNPQDPGVQADYAILEAKERGQGPDDMSGMSASESAKFWTDKFEVGNPGDEQAYAANWLNKIKSGALSSTGDTNNDNDSSDDGVNKFDSPDMSATDSLLLDKFNNFVNEIINKGYGIDIKYGSGNSIGFKVIGDYKDEDIGYIANKYGMRIAFDEHGSYVSDSPTSEYTPDDGDQSEKSTLEQFTAGVKQGVHDVLGAIGISTLVNNADPRVLRNMTAGGAQANYAGTNTVYNTVNVGGVTVTSSNASADDIGQAVADKSLDAVNNRGEYLYRSRAVTGSPEIV